MIDQIDLGAVAGQSFDPRPGAVVQVARAMYYRDPEMALIGQVVQRRPRGGGGEQRGPRRRPYGAL